MSKHGVLVSLSSSVRGLVPLALLSKDRSIKSKFSGLFARGMGVRAVVKSVDGDRRRLILSLIGESKPPFLLNLVAAASYAVVLSSTVLS